MLTLLRKPTKTALQTFQLTRIPPSSFDTGKLRAFQRHELDRALGRPELEALWRQDHEDAQNALKSGKGSTDTGERRAIYYLIAYLLPQSILEIGTHRGASTVLMAKALERFVGENARLTTVDVEDVNTIEDGRVPPRRALQDLQLDRLVRFVTQPALPFIAQTTERYDLIFLDGDHSAPAVYTEVSAALAVLKPDGVILLHDYHPNNRHVFKSGMPIPGPYLAVERMKREGHPVDVVPFGTLPWATRGGTENASCLALLTRPTP